jgi:hypothetical protein
VSSSKPELRRRLVGCWGRSDVVVEGSAEIVEAEGSLMDSMVVALSEIVAN